MFLSTIVIASIAILNPDDAFSISSSLLYSAYKLQYWFLHEA